MIYWLPLKRTKEGGGGGGVDLFFSGTGCIQCMAKCRTKYNFFLFFCLPVTLFIANFIIPSGVPVQGYFEVGLFTIFINMDNYNKRKRINEELWSEN